MIFIFSFFSSHASNVCTYSYHLAPLACLTLLSALSSLFARTAASALFGSLLIFTAHGCYVFIHLRLLERIIIHPPTYMHTHSNTNTNTKVYNLRTYQIHAQTKEKYPSINLLLQVEASTMTCFTSQKHNSAEHTIGSIIICVAAVEWRRCPAS